MFCASKSDYAISVVIPVYNAAEYIGECLESLLIQTFQDFEVIVVDDCSTDNSVAVVMSYKPKFNGRLTFAKKKKNSAGGGYVPRNIGLKLASGEYVFFADGDDFIIGNALETLYNAAKEYDADVVYTGARYNLDSPNDVSRAGDGERSKLLKRGLKDETTLTVDDTEKNLQRLLVEGNYHTPWTRFVRRNFLLENKIVFPEIVTGGDFLWVLQVYCHAKRFLRLPIPLYFYRRYSSASVTTKNKNSLEQITYVFSAFAAWSKSLDKLSNKFQSLRETSNYIYLALQSGLKYRLNVLSEVLAPLNGNAVYELLYRELSKGEAAFSSLAPFFFCEIAQREKELIKLRQRNAELEKELKRLNNRK